jgi:hypothetical protein
MFESKYATAKSAIDDLNQTAEAAIASINTEVVSLNTQLSAAVTAKGVADAALLDNQAAFSAYKKATTSPLASLPSVEADIQARSGWIQPSNAGDSGGSSAKPSGTFLFTPGKVAVFSAQGAYPYNNGYWYYKLGAQNDATRFLYRFLVQYPTAADLVASQALEFELQQTIAGKVYNMAWQAPFKRSPDLTGKRYWRTFDYTASRTKAPGEYWHDTQVVLDSTIFGDSKLVAVDAEYRRNPDDTITHVALSLNGQRFPVGVTRPGYQEAAKGTYSGFNVAFQLDSNSKTPPTPYKVNVEGMEVHWV